MNTVQGLRSKVKGLKTFHIGFMGVLLLASSSFSQEAPFHGFVQANYSVRIADTDDAPFGMSAREHDLILGDERVQLELTRYSEAGRASFSAKLDIYRDAMDGKAKLDLREAYLDLSLGRFDFRIGRQIITWGLGDLVFINDIFPKDWVAFLSGRPLEYLKIGSDALNVSFHPGFLSFQAILIPFFEPDNLPTGERLFYYNPLVPQAKSIETVEPMPQFDNFEGTLRLYRTLGNLDLSLYGYRGFYRMPGMQFDQVAEKLTFFYPKLSVYGGSAQGALFGGVFSLEGGYYDSRKDRNGTDPSIENPQIKFLAGYQRAYGADFTLGVQYFGEAMLKYSQYEKEKTLPQSYPKRKELRHNITLRVMRFFKYQILRLSIFTWVSPNEEDYYLNPEIRYSFTDELWAAVGANVLGGKEEHTFFGQFEQNDNLYLTVRYGF